MRIVRIVNLSKNAVIAQQAEVAETLGQRMRGLLGRDELDPGKGLILKPCTSVHTCFMRFPIDVVFLNKKLEVIRIFPHLPPYHFSPIVWSSAMAIELPAGTISQTNTQIGDLFKVA